MNKNQLKVAWIMGIGLSALLFEVLSENSHFNPFVRMPTPWSYLVVILIIGGLLIYTLKDKKK